MSHRLQLFSPTWHSLRQFLPSASYVGCGNIVFDRLTTHSQDCAPGALFVALSGSAHRNGEFLKQAVQNGVSGILTDHPCSDIQVPQCVVGDVRYQYGQMCQKLAQRPADQLHTVGVTGTNGKTTVCTMLRSIYRAAEHQTGLLGTVEYDDGANPPEAASLTTPDAATLATWMARMVQQQTTHLAMEYSSHAIDQRRIAGITLAAAVITNISRDHLDYHGDFTDYQTVKARITASLAENAPLIINGDDPAVAAALQLVSHPTQPIRIGFGPDNDYVINIRQQSLSGGEFELRGVQNGFNEQFTVSMPGRHNLFNAAVASVTALKTGCSVSSIQLGLAKLMPPAGRMQEICCGQPFSCFVDYAHTPAAIEQALGSLKPLVQNRLICVFGAGGDRDREKRPEMARAAQHADVIVLTADNSRSEPTEQIIAQISAGFSPSRSPDAVIYDRAEAIDWAVQQARPGDCLAILGKGHELTQQIGDSCIDFDDAAQARSSISRYFPQNTQNANRRSA